MRFGLTSLAQVGVLPGLVVSVAGRLSVTTAAQINGIQFFANGVDVSSQAIQAFASGYQYHIGVPLTPVPEPATVGLLAIGLVGVGLAAWRRRAG